MRARLLITSVATLAPKEHSQTEQLPWLHALFVPRLVRPATQPTVAVRHVEQESLTPESLEFAPSVSLDVTTTTRQQQLLITWCAMRVLVGAIKTNLEQQAYLDATFAAQVKRTMLTRAIVNLVALEN